MSTHPRGLARFPAIAARRWIRGPGYGVVALALLLPGSADCYTLERLLRLPLRQLLELRITSHGPAAERSIPEARSTRDGDAS
jgi:hypothetical protein